MKTTNFRLLATMFTLAAVITIATPSNAQRRNTESRTVNRTEKSDSDRKEVVQKKNTTQNHNSKPQSTSRSKVNNSYEIKRNSSSAQNNKSNKNQSQAISRSNDRSSNSYRSPKTTQANSNKSNKNQSQAISRSNDRSSNSYRSPKITQANSSKSNQSGNRTPSVQSNTRKNDNSLESSAVGINRQSNGSDRRSQSQSISNGYERPESRSETGRTKIDENDRRYTPNRDYRGSNKYWTERERPSKMNYNHSDKNFWKNYNYNKYNHWDRSWENYRWSANSWRDYYSGYNPYSFRYSKYYYHHYRYGHVLRRFAYQPEIYIHNHHKYYCYDGHFFRYHRGIGYVLVDIPYGFYFDYLPGDFERVYVNGYLYFRIGNLFFEYNGYGYQLIHYPERYFSINIDFAVNDWMYNEY